jgi:hypothetical protein
MTKASNSRNVLRREVAAIRRLKKRVASHGKAWLADIIEIGGRLERLKARIPHGDWLPLLKKEFEWSVATADNYIAAKRLSRSPEFKRLRNLPLELLYLLGRRKVSNEFRAAVAARAEAGEKITVQKVRLIPPQEQRGAYRFTSYPSPSQERHDEVKLSEAASTPLKPLTTEDFQAISRRNFVDLIVRVADQLPHDQSFEEACAVVESIDAEGRRERFSAAVAKLYVFVGQLQRALNEQQIDDDARPPLRVIPGNKDAAL